MKALIKYYILLAAVLVWLMPLNTFAKQPLNVHVSIMPQKYFVERIGKTNVKVDVLVKPGKNPATYSPSPDQIKKLMSADVYFRIGVPFENGILHKIKAIAGAKVVDTRQGIILREMEEQDHNAEHQDNKNHHDSVGKDPHIWMSPLIVKTQAHTIFEALYSIDQNNRDEYKKNYELFVKDLDELDHRLKTILKDLKMKNLFVFHPSFGYFTDAYDLKQVAIETMGKTPKGKTLSNIIKLAKKQKTRVIFAQPQFDRNTAEKIASAINGVVVFIDPLSYDYLANMENIAQSIAGVLKK
ncbi:zinc ABC transporter substrate-binding protein [Desulfobacula sp.]|uniref:metal ABC transporter solute-binding protein, Zn/Mn family n=1 Tax=Desulfobacula sp. TaxID=2593537 RepID=UPI0025BB81AB|nr:zinc ABC transporter substrate-binding protein [Desulfobacula sp.]MBC2703764.1 zinc ABC transporter substrate-binding protein [Desulfobacula sp.]